MTSNDDFKSQIETTSRRFGNSKTIEDAFNRPAHPTAIELATALAETAHLSQKEAFAFAHGWMEGHPGETVTDKDVAEEIVRAHGFHNLFEFTETRDLAQKKIADAIWIYELIDAYRFPGKPEECSRCGAEIDDAWTVPLEVDQKTGVLCRPCARDEREDESS